MIELTADTRHFEAGMKKASQSIREFVEAYKAIPTVKQRAIHQFLRDFFDVHKKPPTVREIQAHFGYRSTNSVTSLLDALERKGFIRRVKRQSRNIVFLNKRSNSTREADAVE